MIFLETYWATIKDMFSTVGGFLTAITPLIVGIMAFYQWKMNRKVDGYHREVNGKMGELLDTTKKLGNAEGRADLTQEQKGDK